jgi:hypothetical protein
MVQFLQIPAKDKSVLFVLTCPAAAIIVYVKANNLFLSFHYVLSVSCKGFYRIGYNGTQLREFALPAQLTGLLSRLLAGNCPGARWVCRAPTSRARRGRSFCQSWWVFELDECRAAPRRSEAEAGVHRLLLFGWLTVRITKVGLRMCRGILSRCSF